MERALQDSLTLSCCREIPHELVQAAQGGEVDINIEDKRNDPFVQRASKLVAFSGEGRKLGRYCLQLCDCHYLMVSPCVSSFFPSLAPSVVRHSQEQTAEATPTDLTPTIPLDPAQSTTSVQIRLADGTRLGCRHWE